MTSLRSAINWIDSAVLAPVYRDADGELRLVLVVRGPRGIHGSQIGLPGGRREAEDASLLVTALREAEEEIGLERGRVEVLAELPVVDTFTTGYRIAPYLGRIVDPPVTWRRQEEEIADVLELLVAHLARPEAHAEEVWHWPGWPAPQRVPFYYVGGGHKLWGATYRIVQPLLPRLLAQEWTI